MLGNHGLFRTLAPGFLHMLLVIDADAQNLVRDLQTGGARVISSRHRSGRFIAYALEQVHAIQHVLQARLTRSRI